MNIYQKMYTDIINLKCSGGNHPKIYKPILILAYFDYCLDNKDLNTSYFSNLICIENFIEYIVLYLRDPKLTEFLSPDIKSDQFAYKNLIHRFREQPLRRIIKDSKDNNFFHNELMIEPKSRKNDDLPRKFGVFIDEEFEYDKMIKVIRDACKKKILNLTSIEIEPNAIEQINSHKNDSTVQNFESLQFENNRIYSHSRTGQSIYRNKMLKKYHNTCAFCSINLPALLIASHAKPWCKSVDLHEKLSENNGLLLCANHDKLFDSGLISYDLNTKQIIFSSKLNDSSIEFHKSSLQKSIDLNFDPQFKKYINYHYEYIFQK